MHRRLTTTLGGLAAVAALAVPLAAVAAAEDAPAAGSPTTTTVAEPAPGAGALRRLHRRALGRKVAEHLGISVADLRAAVREARSHPPAAPIEDRRERRAYWLHQGALALGVSDEQLRTAIADARAELRAERGRDGGG